VGPTGGLNAILKKNICGTHTVHCYLGGTRWCSWFRNCVTSWKVAGSIPDGVTGIFHCHNTFGRTKSLGVDSASNRKEYQEYFLGG
jgi:hypothetical protein